MLVALLFAQTAISAVALTYKYTGRNVSEFYSDGFSWEEVSAVDRIFPVTQVLTGEFVYAGAIDSLYDPETGMGIPHRPLWSIQGSAGQAAYKADFVEGVAVNAAASDSCQLGGISYDCLAFRAYDPFLKANSVNLFPPVSPLLGLEPITAAATNIDLIYAPGNLGIETVMPKYPTGFDQGFLSISYTDLDKTAFLYSLNSDDVRLQILPDPFKVIGVQGGWAYARFEGRQLNNAVLVKSGADASQLGRHEYFSLEWTVVSLDKLQDGNSDGTGDDPAIVVLADSIETRQHKVQVRDAISGQQIGSNIGFLNSKFAVIDLAVIPDINGDGVTDDPAVAVLGVNLSNGRPAVEVRRLSDGVKLGRWQILSTDFDPQAISATKVGSDARLGILAANGSGKVVVETRRAADGTRLGRFFAFGSGVSVRGLAGYADINGPEAGSNGAWVVLGKKDGANNIVRYLAAENGAKLKDQIMTGSSWESFGLAVAPDQNGNGFEDIATINNSDTAGLLKLRDFNTGDTVSNLLP